LGRAATDQKGRWHLVIPVLALIFQFVPPVLLWVIATAAYREPRRLSEAWERPVSLVALGACAGISWLLGSFGVYGLLTCARLRIALLLIVVCCAPALLGGAAYLHGLLVFLALV
jgi:hypothetical protein